MGGRGGCCLLVLLNALAELGDVGSKGGCGRGGEGDDGGHIRIGFETVLTFAFFDAGIDVCKQLLFLLLLLLAIVPLQHLIPHLRLLFRQPRNRFRQCSDIALSGSNLGVGRLQLIPTCRHGRFHALGCGGDAGDGCRGEGGVQGITVLRYYVLGLGVGRAGHQALQRGGRECSEGAGP